ncbi:MAG: hypothetical protein M3261_00655 [Thermoproteota archaeon]|nr:hypothetical protein [Thermoproteota archaeon]
MSNQINLQVVPATVKAATLLIILSWLLGQINEWLTGRLTSAGAFPLIVISSGIAALFFALGLLRLQRVFWWWSVIGYSLAFIVIIWCALELMSPQAGQSRPIIANIYILLASLLLILAELILLFTPSSRKAFGIISH